MTKQIWAEEVDGRVATKNCMGFMFTELAGSTPYFIEYSRGCSDTILDIGCAYGVATLPVLAQSKAQVIACDPEKQHLDVLRSLVADKYSSRISYLEAAFPYGVNLPAESVDAINISYVLHFLKGEDFEAAIAKCYQMLRPGGKLFINNLSVHFCLFKDLIGDYDAKLAQGKPWPGLVHNIRDHQLSDEDSARVPEFLNLISLAFQNQLLTRHGFAIETSFYYDIKKPNTFGSEDKGCIAAVAVKSI